MSLLVHLQLILYRTSVYWIQAVIIVINFLLPSWSVLCNDHITGLNSSKNYRAQKRMYKQRWDEANLMLFYAITGTHLQSIDVPKHLLHDNINYERDIEKYYDDIISVLLEASKLSVPSIPCQALKNFWNDDLDYLKQQSIDIHNLWKEIGKPHHGLINKARIHAKSEYKRAVRDAADDFEKSHIDEVTEYFAHKDMNNFWKCWSTKYNKHVNSDNISINGCQNAQDIANAFREHYANIFVNSADEKNKVQQFIDARLNYSGDVGTDTLISVEDIEAALRNLKKGKAAGADCIVAEHILHCHPSIIVHLKLLFHMMLLHGYVPDYFG